MALVKAELYQSAIFEKYEGELAFGFLYQSTQTQTIKWMGARTIQLPTMTTTGMGDRDRTAMTDLSGRSQGFTTEWVPRLLTHEREKDFFVDKYDTEESAQVATIGNATKVFNKTQKVPELDVLASSRLFASATSESAQYPDVVRTEDLTTGAQIKSAIDLMVVFWNENGVPMSGRYIVINATKYDLLAGELEASRRANYTTDTEFKREVLKYNGCTIVQIQSNRFYSEVNFSVAQTGWTPAPTGKVLNFIGLHLDSTYAPMKHNDTYLTPASAITKGKNLFYESMIVDVVTAPNKPQGVVVSIPTT